ncbi:MAG: hypothetical protein CL927_20905 [Deltaproteobacteria bacterium]|nr:hypothetical protein [Deltaproteobacteria bacterium]HCH61537.1 hypothetical protein [Deltaproteobacteria bacterium]
MLIGLRIWVLGCLVGVASAAPSDPAATDAANRRPRSAMVSGALPQSGDATLDGQQVRAQMMLRRQRYRRVLSETRKGLEAHPTDPALHQMQAIALAEFGDYHGAQESFELAMGSEFAIVLALVAEADTLRMLDEPGAAQAVRAELLNSGVSSNRELVMLSRLFEDYRYHNDVEGMWAVAHRATALDPTTSLAHAMMALSHIAMGNEAEAGAALWTAQRYGGASALASIAEIEFHLAFERPMVALQVSDERREKVLKSKAFMVSRGRALLAAGEVHKAVDMCDLTVWRMSGDLWDPSLLIIQAVTYARMGWVDESRAIMEELQRSYPHLAAVQEAMQAVEAASLSGTEP